MKKVLLSYLSLIHYRKSVFEILMEEKDVDFRIVCSETSPYQNLKNFTPREDLIDKVTYLKIKSKEVLNHKFIYQEGLISEIKKTKPDILILLGFDPHIISNITAFFYVKLFTNIKIYWWGHGSVGKQGAIGKYLRRFFYNQSDGVLVYSSRGKTDLKSIGVKTKITRIGNCINLNDYGFLNFNLTLNKRLIHKEEIVVVYSGRITPEKRIDDLIKAIAIVKELVKGDFKIVCNIIGDGSYLDKLKDNAHKLNVFNNINFHGSLYGEEASDVFLKSNIAVIPGDAGLSVIHSLSFGLPVITHDNLCSHKPEIEVIEAGTNGEFYRFEDPYDLAKVIVSLWLKMNIQNSNIINNCVNSIVDFKYLPADVANNLKSISHVD